MKDSGTKAYHGESVDEATAASRSLKVATIADEPLPSQSRSTETFIYPDGLGHLTDELVYVRALLSRYLQRSRGLRPDEGLSGLAVGAAEIERFLAGAVPPRSEDHETFLVELRKTIDERVNSSLAAGQPLPLVRLMEAFDLSALEIQALMVLLAPEVEPGFDRAYAFAWNDFTRKTCDLGFVLAMVSDDFRERAERVDIFEPGGALVRHGLVDIERSELVPNRTFLARRIRLHPRVVSFVLGSESPAPSIAARCRLVQPNAVRDDLLLQPADLEPLWSALHAELDRGPCRLALRGARGSGRRLLMEAALRERGGRMLVVDLAGLLHQDHPLGPALDAAIQECRLQDSALYLECSGVELDGEEGFAPRAIIESSVGKHPGAVVFGVTQRAPFFGGSSGDLVDLFVPMPEATEREELWRRALADEAPLSDEVNLADVARQHPLTGGAIADAASKAGGSARRRNADRPEISSMDLAEAARNQLTSRLSHLATRITHTLSWDDLVLPEDAMGSLHELTAFARHHKKVFEQWGFGAILPYGRGLSALFHGPPGTGKTMVAGIIAGELGMDLFRVDLSRIVSKYVGETEKNLARIFDEASQSHSVLLFDEADSLFSKRTQVKSATDRYANLEVNYLLQRMEDFEGVTILTTNFESGLDDAFKRRLRFRIKFPAPDEEARRALWQKMLPEAADLADEIRFEELAWDYELTGGHIKNAVLRAAFSAARRGDGIRHDDLKTAGAQECREIGKLVREWAEDNEGVIAE